VVRKGYVYAGICLFPMESKVEFFVEEFPDCCFNKNRGEAQGTYIFP
jgi:hypothetical protein